EGELASRPATADVVEVDQKHGPVDPSRRAGHVGLHGALVAALAGAPPVLRALDHQVAGEHLLDHRGQVLAPDTLAHGELGPLGGAAARVELQHGGTLAAELCLPGFEVRPVGERLEHALRRVLRARPIADRTGHGRRLPLPVVTSSAGAPTLFAVPLAEHTTLRLGGPAG